MANQIAAHRQAEELTQTDLAEAVGWRQSRWSAYELGNRIPDVNDARQILRAFRVLGVELEFADLFPNEDLAEAS